MIATQKQANDDVNIAEIEEIDETDDLEHPETWITAEEWFHELGGMLVNHFGDEIREGLNESLVRHRMKPLP
jgi:hypothetical protein